MARGVTLVVAATIVAALPAPSSAEAPPTGSAWESPAAFTRVNVGPTGDPIAGANSRPMDLSPDARFLLLSDTSSELAPGDANERSGARDVFVWERETGRLDRVSVASDGAGANSFSGVGGSISDDGRFVVFSSRATNLAPGDGGPGVCAAAYSCEDVFLRDRQNGTTERVTVGMNGKEPNADCLNVPYCLPYISGNGRYILYSTFASNIVPGDTAGTLDTFVHDREAGTTELVSPRGLGDSPDDHWMPAGVSTDGSYALLMCSCAVQVGTTILRATRFFRLDLNTLERTRVATHSAGTPLPPYASDYSAAMSSDGRYVAYLSAAAGVPSDQHGNQRSDLYVRDFVAGKVEKLNIIPVMGSGVHGADMDNVAISDNGRFVAVTAHGNMSASVVNPPPTYEGTVVIDRQTHAVDLVPVSRDGVPARSTVGLVSDDGRYVAFKSEDDFVDGNPDDGGHDTFIADRGTDGAALGLRAIAHDGAVRVGGSVAQWARQTVRVTDPVDSHISAGDITGVTAGYDPAPFSVWVHVDLAHIPSVGFYTVSAGIAPVDYRLSFDIADRSYDLSLASVRRQPGVIGHAERFVVNLGAYGAKGGDVVRNIRVRTTAGGISDLAPAGATDLQGTELDAVEVGDVRIPRADVRLAVTPAAQLSPPEHFPISVGRMGFDFDAVTATAEPESRVWVRACIDDACTVNSTLAKAV